jgi:methyl-accepting chemotaxis protein
MNQALIQAALGRRSIRERLVLTIGLLVLAILLFQGMYFPMRYRQSAVHGLESKALAVVQALCHAAAPTLTSGDRARVDALLTSVAKDPDLSYIGVYAPDGGPIATWAGHGTAAPAHLSWGNEPRVDVRDGLVVVTAPVLPDSVSRGGVVAAFSTATLTVEARDNLFYTLGIGVGLWGIALLAAARIGGGIRRRIEVVVRQAQDVASGNLRLAVLQDAGDDEISALVGAFNEMVRSQQYLVRQISTTASQIKSTSTEILASARQQEQGATEQSSAVEETRQTMESLLQSGRQIADSASLVLSNAERTQTNNQIISQRITRLSTHMQRITEILEVIKSIATKSDMLALNAALEGTKAGESGRGFSLVASQMRRLTENVMGAVHDIKALTGDVHESTSASVVATEDGTKLASDTTRSARQISLIIQQQQTGTEQVSKAMDDVSQIAQQTAAASKQSLRTTKELTELSEQLDHLVNRFTLETSGDPP